MATLSPRPKPNLLTAVDGPSPVTLTDREKGASMIRRGIALSGLASKQISEKDHGQFSRECDGKEKLSFHEMVASWPPAVLREIATLLLLQCGAEVVTEIRLTRIA